VGDVDTDRIRVLQHVRHGNKLKTGHSRGNRFEIQLRDVAENAAANADHVREVIARQGFPNYFGDQRFGTHQETLDLGLELLVGTKRPRDIPASRRRFLLRLALSAAQSHLFNRALAERLSDDVLHRVMAGDVMQVTTSGGLFVVEEVEREQQRFDAGETVITGPIFGPKMRSPQGEPAAREQRVLAECGVSEADFLRHRKLTSGTRRPYIVRPHDLTVSPDQHGLRLEFTLPRGSYATTLLREFQEGGSSSQGNVDRVSVDTQ
jgi:tRNA pseudouridine13 synthase